MRQETSEIIDKICLELNKFLPDRFHFACILLDMRDQEMTMFDSLFNKEVTIKVLEQALADLQKQTPKEIH